MKMSSAVIKPSPATGLPSGISSPPAEENIRLSLPMNAAYVSAARLTASSIANRIGFDTDEIEDVKAAVSEACTFIIKKWPSDGKTNLRIQFHMEEGTLTITIKAQGGYQPDRDEMSFVMIQALMDKITIDSGSGEADTVIAMVKNHKATLFQ